MNEEEEGRTAAEWKAMWEEERQQLKKERMRAEHAEWMWDTAERALEKERKAHEKERKKAEELQDTFIRQSGTNKIPLTTYQLVHKTGTSPCMPTSTAQAEGTFHICTVKEHWQMEEVDTILVQPTAGEGDAIIGNDVLGGRHKDIPKDVHKRMVKLAAKNGIPITTPRERKFWALKRRTYQGDMTWKWPVKYGYLHPDLPPPKGFFWKRRMWSCGLFPTSQTTH